MEMIMDICINAMTGLVVSTAIRILLPYLVYALARYLKIRVDAAARETIDSARLLLTLPS